MFEDVLADRALELAEHLAEVVGREQRDQLLAIVGREEAHQIGEVGRVQGRDQLAQTRGVAAIGGVDHHVDIGRVQRIVVAKGEILQVFGGGRSQGLVRRSGHAVYPVVFASALLLLIIHWCVERN